MNARTLHLVASLTLFLAAPVHAADTAKPGVRHKVQSTEIAWVVYEDKTSTLLLARRDGFVSEYYGVPADVYRQLMSNDFMGGFVKANIDRKYPTKLARLQTPKS